MLAAPDRWSYADLSITPPEEDEFDRLGLYHQTRGGTGALDRKRREDALRAKNGDSTGSYPRGAVTPARDRVAADKTGTRPGSYRAEWDVPAPDRRTRSQGFWTRTGRHSQTARNTEELSR